MGFFVTSADRARAAISADSRARIGIARAWRQQQARGIERGMRISVRARLVAQQR
jgi:hypothetical protein